MAKTALNYKVVGFIEFTCLNCGETSKVRLDDSDVGDSCVTELMCEYCKKWSKLLWK